MPFDVAFIIIIIIYLNQAKQPIEWKNRKRITRNTKIKHRNTNKGISDTNYGL